MTTQSPPTVSAEPAELAARILAQLNGDDRFILGLTGPPGTGKSTVVTAIAEALHPHRVAVVPMDGFHLANTVIRGTPLEQRKGAIDTFTRAVAVDLAPWGIRVNALRPGMIAVDYWEGLSAEEKARRIQAIPIGREGRPADIAWAAVFLAADDAGFVTGQNFEVDGGMLTPGRSAQAELGAVNTPESIGEF